MSILEFMHYKISYEDTVHETLRWPVAIESNGLSMRGEIVMPKEIDQPKPIVLLLHGAGKDYDPLVHTRALQDKLAKEGIISLAYTSRGVGKSQGNFTDYTLTERKEDALKAFTWVKKHLKGKIQEEKVGIIAASMGGHIAAQLSQELPNVKGVVLYEPAAYTAAAQDKQFDKSFHDEIHKEDKDLSTFPAFAALKNFDGKLFVAYGKDDKVIPEEVKQHYKQIAMHKTAGKYIVLPGMEHNLLSLPKNPEQTEQIEKLHKQTVDFLTDAFACKS